jgi:hypothetical protein
MIEIVQMLFYFIYRRDGVLWSCLLRGLWALYCEFWKIYCRPGSDHMKFHTIKKLKTNQMKNNLFDTDCADRH